MKALLQIIALLLVLNNASAQNTFNNYSARWAFEKNPADELGINNGNLHGSGALVGAIRWDAWHSHTPGVNQEPVKEMEKSLSPKAYQFRAPFFANIVDSNEIRIGGYTQEIIDQEIDFANTSGLDYWAFLLYDEGTSMSEGLDYYLSSTKKQDMNFCAMEQANLLLAKPSNEIPRLVNLIKDPSYQMVLGNRPLIYFYGMNEDWLNAYRTQGKTIFDNLRAAIIAENFGDPYIVVMHENPAKAKEIHDAFGLNALSRYAMWGNGGYAGATYAELRAFALNDWDNYKAQGLDVVPNVTSGWNREPRIVNPVYWETWQQPGVGIDNTYELPTPQELSDHVQEGINWVKKNEAICSPAKLVLIYAWNEHDEGGWLCPTTADTGSADISRLEKLKNNLLVDGSDYLYSEPKEGSYSISFDGVDGNVSIPNSSTFNNLNSLSLSFWMKIKRLPADKPAFLVGKEGNWGVTLNINGTLGFVVRTSNNDWYSVGSNITSSTVLSPEKWYLVTAVYDGVTSQKSFIYINGELDTENLEILSGTTNDWEIPFTCAKGDGIYTDYFTGSFDDLRFYNIALSSNETRLLYNSYLNNYHSYSERWTFDNNSTGENNINGNIYGGSSFIDSDKVENSHSLSLDGTTGFFSIQSSSIFNNLNKFSLSFWMKINEIPINNAAFLTGEDNNWRIILNTNGKLGFVIRTSNNDWYSTGSNIESSTALVEGNWYHVTAVYDGLTNQKSYIYIDGIIDSENQETISGSTNDLPIPFTCGEGDGVYTGFFNGLFDDLRFYRIALSDQEVNHLYESYNMPPIQPVSRWKMEQNSYDSRGSNHGDIHGGTIFSLSDIPEGNFALAADGTNDFICVPDNSSMEDLNAFCIAFWMKVSNMPDENAMILGKEGVYRVILDSNGRLNFVISTSNNSWYSNGTNLSSNDLFSVGDWNHVCVGYDGEKTYIYFNGQIDNINPFSLSGQIINNSNDFVMAKQVASNIDYYSGILDDVMFFPFMPNDLAIQELYSYYSYQNPLSVGAPGQIIHPNDVPQNKLDILLIYPNPAKDIVFIRGLGSETIIQIINATGILMHREKTNENNLSINTSQFKEGIYFISISDGLKKITRKFIVQQ